MSSITSRSVVLVQYLAVGLIAIAAVEYFKYSTMIHYDWFHCTPTYENVSSTSDVQKLFSVGGPSCDKRGEFKTIAKRIGRDFPVNKQRKSFCIVENKSLDYKHYPVENGNKGEPGYVAFIGTTHDSDSMLDLKQICGESDIFNI
ncbi:hypothetical protein ACO0SA_002065 [Hanseniaspora valbyensis]